MAAKNAESTIRSAVRSCLWSLSKGDELLVFLDGCEDNTESVVRSIKDSRLRIFKSHVSVGRSTARNKLIAESKGEYLAIQDSDDLSLPWRFSCSRRLLRRYDVVFGNGVIFGSRLRFLPFAPLYPFAIKPTLAPIILTYRNPFIHSGAILKKSLLSGGLRYEDVPAEEYLLWIELAQKKALMFRTRFPQVGYRLHTSQVTNSESFAKEVADNAEIRSAQALLAREFLRELAEVEVSLDATDFRLRLQELVHKRSMQMRFEEMFLFSLRAFLRRAKEKLGRGHLGKGK